MECGQIFYGSCFKIHENADRHKISIDSDMFDLKSKKAKDLFKENYIGYCNEYKVQFCNKCKEKQNCMNRLKLIIW